MITNETRRESYDLILETLGKRQKLVYDALKITGPVTANELATHLYYNQEIHTPERNAVHPRLNELVEMDAVEIIGKKKCSITKKSCAVYRVKEVESPQLSFDI